VKFDVRNFNITPFGIYEFRENWRREDLTFVFVRTRDYVYACVMSPFDILMVRSTSAKSTHYGTEYPVAVCSYSKSSCLVNTDNSIQIQIRIIQSL